MPARANIACASESASSARARIPTRGELEGVGPIAGFMVHRHSSDVFPLTSYNPRRFADSRRRWAALTREQVARVSATSVVTLTHRAEFHGVQIDREVIAHDSAAARLLLQRLTRLAIRIDAADVCWKCLRAWSDRLALNPRSPFKPCRPYHRKPWHGAQGNCAHCGEWERINFYEPRIDEKTGECADWRPRGAWLCSRCSSGRTHGPPTVRFAVWVREPGKSLQHLHRHALFDGPYIPQWLLSRLAWAAGFGAVLDVRKYRHANSTSNHTPLREYLTKTASTPALDPLSAYFAKVAMRPDEFNALPKGIPRKRAPAVPSGPSEWYFSRYDPRVLKDTSCAIGGDLSAALKRVSPRLFVCGPAEVRVVRRLRPPGCVCLSEWNCLCGAAWARGEAQPATTELSAAVTNQHHFFARPSHPSSRARANFGMLRASSQAVPHEECGAMSEACGSREAVDSSLHLMTDPKERFARARARRQPLKIPDG